MAQDKYSALWVSHSRIKDFSVCPRSYYLKYKYRDPKTGHKIKLMSAPLALGQVVHTVLESLQVKPVKNRFEKSLIVQLHEEWKNIEGKKGGFPDSDIEQQYKTRAESILLNVMKNPGPLSHLAVKIKMDFPYFWLSEEKNIILNGKLDWMEYLPETDSVHIIDFKTSKHEEDDDSLQLPIYYLLAKNCQMRRVQKMSYWYLERGEEGLVEKGLPDEEDTLKKVAEKADEILLATRLNRFKCKNPDGCYACKPYEMILKKEAEFVYANAYKEDVYVLDSSSATDTKESEIL